MLESLKFWVALIGGLATAAVTVFGGDTTVGKCASLVLAALTAGGVWVARNGPAPEQPTEAPKP